jgi:nitrate reductase NapAB chaperone NapD
MSNDLEFLIKLVKEASLLINNEFEVKAKDDNGDLVTNFDYEIEKFIINRIKENYSVDNLIDTAANYVVDKIDDTVMSGISNAVVSGNLFYSDTNEHTNSIQATRQGNVLGLIDSIVSGEEDGNYNGWTKSGQSTPPKFGNLRDVGMLKDGMETDINKIIYGNLRDN